MVRRRRRSRRVGRPKRSRRSRIGRRRRHRRRRGGGGGMPMQNLHPFGVAAALPYSMDARIHMGSSMLVCGTADGGKTSFVIRLIESAPRTFDAKVSHVYWFYGIETAQQPLLTKKGFITYRGLPDDFNFCEHNSVVVLDDLMDTAAHHAGVTDLFTKL